MDNKLLRHQIIRAPHLARTCEVAGCRKGTCQSIVFMGGGMCGSIDIDYGHLESGLFFFLFLVPDVVIYNFSQGKCLETVE